MTRMRHDFGVACRGHTIGVAENHESAAAPQPDTHFRWQSPDEATILPFSRDRSKALELSSEWDLCIAGDGLHHLQQAGCEADFIPLTQVGHACLACWHAARRMHAPCMCTR